MINEYDRHIKAICRKFTEAHKCYKIEFDDLYQEAYLKLLTMPQDKHKSYILRSIINHLIDYCRKWNANLLSEAISINDIYKI